MIILMKETGITTVEDLALRLSNTRVQLELMQGDVRSNNQVIHDIDDFFAAIEDYRELAPLQDQLDRIHFKGRREAFQAEHADELKRLRKAAYLREKLSKKLGVSLPLDKAGVKKLKAQRQELTEQNESLRPKLGQIRAELDQLQAPLLDTKGNPGCTAGARRLCRADGSAGKPARAGTGYGCCH